MIVKLSHCEVEIKGALTWGDMQELEAVLASGAKISASGLSGYDSSALIESKYKLLELAIKEIREGESTKEFTREWMNDLSMEDGDTLYKAVDSLQKKISTPEDGN